jgi:hypothetical protein
MLLPGILNGSWKITLILLKSCIERKVLKADQWLIEDHSIKVCDVLCLQCRRGYLLSKQDATFIVNASNTQLMLGSGVLDAFRQRCADAR